MSPGKETAFQNKQPSLLQQSAASGWRSVCIWNSQYGFRQVHMCVHISLPAGGFPTGASSMPKAGCNLALSADDTHFPHVTPQSLGSKNKLPAAAREGQWQEWWRNWVMLGQRSSGSPPAPTASPFGLGAWLSVLRKLPGEIGSSLGHFCLEAAHGRKSPKWKQPHLHIGRWNSTECGKKLNGGLKPNKKLTKTTSFKFNKDLKAILENFWY